jgi:pilus assembly protein FimV
VAHHPWKRSTRLFAACALALVAMHARALTLGDPEVRSSVGDALDLRFPVTLAKGEFIEPSCFKLAAEGDASAPRVAAGNVSLERSAGGTFLRVRTGAPVTDSTIAIGVAASCRGLPGEFKREYTINIEARKSVASAPAFTATAATPAAESASPSTEPSSLLPAIATLIARIGDTLESIARAIFPDNGNARRSYLDALRESNPPLKDLADNEPIPVDTPVALPDLRTFSKAKHTSPASKAAPSAPAPVAREREPEPVAAQPAPEVEKPAKKTKPRAERAAPPALRETTVPREAPAARPAAEPRATKPAAAARAQSGDFVLKLSAPAMDLNASRGIDDRTRAKLRERLMILDADDQVSALLSLRHSVTELETQVADLRLKLSEMPASFPAPKPQPAPAKIEPPKVEAAPAKPEPPKVEPAPAKIEPPPPTPEPPKVEPPKPEPPKVEPPKQEPVKAETSKVEAPPVKASQPTAAAQGTEWVDYGLWALAALFIVIAVLLTLRLVRRNREGYEEEEEPGTHDLRAPDAYDHGPNSDRLDEGLDDDHIVVADELPVDLEVAADEPAPAQAPRREMDADVDLPTHIPANTDDLRRRYIEERFPEIGKGAINLDDPDSVVKGARLFYEDGALARAVELLQYAIERKPEELKNWLALFEVFRLEHLSSEFAELAFRFKVEHSKSDYWPKVQYFGREIDPGNELYREAPINSFETIGPAQARKLAAASNVDPIAENWLGAPMDFENEVLANDLRRTLMADAGISESDLVPNPMPALRNVEMFNVA